MGEHGFFVWEEEESKNGSTVKKEVICWVGVGAGCGCGWRIGESDRGPPT
jgi:hypothetical protein